MFAQVPISNCSSDLCHNGGTCVPSDNEEQVCECPHGFTGAKCQYDVNECMANNGGCEHECVNTIGTFYCRCWPGFELSGDGNTCTDIDECATSNGGCSDRCVNTAGGFRCDCPSDLYLHSDGRTCGKVTSCSVENGGCDHECEDDSNGEFYRCRCRSGFKLSENKRSCQAIDPCLENNGGCQHHCTNNHGRAQCQCYPGFHLSYDRRSCVDIDECAKNNGCEHFCENIKGTYRCKCRDGYQLGRDGRTCEELLGGCQVGNGGCQHDCYDQPDGGHICKCRNGYMLAEDQKLCHEAKLPTVPHHLWDAYETVTCVTPTDLTCHKLCMHLDSGHVQCFCDDGYELVDSKFCQDISECSTNNGGCEQICKNQEGGYMCSCEPGFELSEDGHSCHDINECLINNGGCSQLCKNRKGSRRCQCFAGYVLAHDEKSCVAASESVDILSNELNDDFPKQFDAIDEVISSIENYPADEMYTKPLNAQMDSSVPIVNYPVRIVKTEESVLFVPQDSFQNAIVPLVTQEKNVNQFVRMDSGEWIVLISVPVNCVIHQQDPVDVRIRTSVLMVHVLMATTVLNAISNAVWTAPMVDVIQSLVTVPVQMVSTDKTARNRVPVLLSERIADSRVNVQENTPKGVMKLQENAGANQATMVITAKGCALQDYSVQDALESAPVLLASVVTLSQGTAPKSVRLDTKGTFVTNHVLPAISDTIVSRNAIAMMWNRVTRRKCVIMSPEHAPVYPEKPDHFVINLAPLTHMVRIVLTLALVSMAPNATRGMGLAIVPLDSMVPLVVKVRNLMKR
uniref:Multiple epidermal growth factor-like domains protein 6 n=1 Tax=Caenorhabditis tropicalis TaxID=1561998 RepID=A0A1I7T2K1_9PELO